MHMHVGAVMVLEPDAAGHAGDHSTRYFERVRAVVEERIHLVPPLRRRVVRVPFGLHHPVWVEDPLFDVDYHLRRAQPADPGWPRGARRLRRRRRRPPARSEAARCGRSTSSRGSSRGTWRSSRRSTTPCSTGPRGWRWWRPSSTPARCRAPWSHRRARGGPRRSRPKPSSWARRCRRWCASPSAPRAPCAGPSAPCGTWPSAIGGCAKRTRSPRRRRRSGRPRTSLNGAISPHRRFAFAQVPLDEVRAVRRAFGGTVNDVVLAAVAGALRRLLSRAR